MNIDAAIIKLFCTLWFYFVRRFWSFCFQRLPATTSRESWGNKLQRKEQMVFNEYFLSIKEKPFESE